MVWRLRCKWNLFFKMLGPWKKHLFGNLVSWELSPLGAVLTNISACLGKEEELSVWEHLPPGLGGVGADAEWAWTYLTPAPVGFHWSCRIGTDSLNSFF